MVELITQLSSPHDKSVVVVCNSNVCVQYLTLSLTKRLNKIA